MARMYRAAQSRRARLVEFEPGPRGRVLRNLIGITSQRAMERKESEAWLISTEQTIDETRIDQRFTAGDIQRIIGFGLEKSIHGLANIDR